MSSATSELRSLVVTIPADVDDSALQPLLAAAKLIVTEDLAGSGLSSDRLALIQTYLAAHFAVIAYEMGGMTGQKKGESSESYRGIAGTQVGLLSTRFGQAVAGMDETGTLVKLLNPKKARFQVIRAGQLPFTNPNIIFNEDEPTQLW